MPELPEVETVKNGLAPHLTHQSFQDVKVFRPKLRWPIPEKLDEILKNVEIQSLSRRGKYLLLHTKKGTLIIHLGMSGSLSLHEAPYLAREKHDHVEFQFQNCLVRYNDPRRFGCILWTEENLSQHPLLCNLGPEPLSADFNVEYLYQKSLNKKKPVKNFIMDHHIVVGVGNIYACETLFKTHIHPNLPTHKLTKKMAQTLTSQIKETLQEAIIQGGTTLKDFKNTEGKPGYFKQSLFVYGRKGQPCLNCDTPIESMTIGQRNTFFCPSCQKIKK